MEMSKGDGPIEWVIIVSNFDWHIRDQGTLIHEIVHTIVKIWKSNNVECAAINQEFLAHEVGNLYEDICRKIFTKTKRHGTKKTHQRGHTKKTDRRRAEAMA
jgi:hypothetical protein